MDIFPESVEDASIPTIPPTYFAPVIVPLFPLPDASIAFPEFLGSSPFSSRWYRSFVFESGIKFELEGVKFPEYLTVSEIRNSSRLP